MVVLLLVILIGGIVLLLRQNTSDCPIEIMLPTPSCAIEVHVAGAVQNPGVHVLSEGARAVDALNIAGGFAPDADQSSINLSRVLRDGAQIYVPRFGESAQRININTADAWLLDALPGIGETLASRIIEYRTHNGPFGSVDDLKKVKGISDATYTKLSDKITVR